MLYQADVREQPIAEILAAEAERAQNEPDRMASWLYARDIVDGVTENQQEIDELLATYAQGWTLQRMPHIDRAVLRIASWEILFNSEVPAPVAIDEALELVKTYSTEDSARFVNGVLGRIVEHTEL